MVLRIFAPVLDSPTHLQLQASFDTVSTIPPAQRSFKHDSRIFLWDPCIFNDYIRPFEGSDDYRKVEKILDGGWDLFAVALVEGSLVLRGVIVSTPRFLH